jgi:hypothetical protein
MTSPAIASAFAGLSEGRAGILSRSTAASHNCASLRCATQQLNPCVFVIGMCSYERLKNRGCNVASFNSLKRVASVSCALRGMATGESG